MKGELLGLLLVVKISSLIAGVDLLLYLIDWVM